MEDDIYKKGDRWLLARTYSSLSAGDRTRVRRILMERQDGCCAICGTSMNVDRRSLAIDHDHKNDRIRELLCLNCNAGLGMFRDSVELLRNAIKYVDEHSTKRPRGRPRKAVVDPIVKRLSITLEDVRKTFITTGYDLSTTASQCAVDPSIVRALVNDIIEAQLKIKLRGELPKMPPIKPY